VVRAAAAAFVVNSLVSIDLLQLGGTLPDKDPNSLRIEARIISESESSDSVPGAAKIFRMPSTRI
jgi:hypothetical protein